MFLTLDGPPKELKVKVRTNDGTNTLKTYSLCASSIDVTFQNKLDRKTSSHAIAGLHCDELFYIYDSNNYLNEYDWSTQNFERFELEVLAENYPRSYSEVQNYDILFYCLVEE